MQSGRTHARSGVSLTIADATTPREAVLAARQFLIDCSERSMSFSSQGVATGLSFGITVGDSAQYIASVDLTVDDPAMMTHLGEEADEPGPHPRREALCVSCKGFHRREPGCLPT